MKEDTRIVTEALKVDVPDDPSVTNGAGIDDSTSLPTLLVLALRRWVNHIICAKPDDQHWVSVHFSEQKFSLYNWNDMICFHSLLSFGGHCYVATTRGDLMMVDLCPRTAKGPRMVYVSRLTALSVRTAAYPYLVRSLDQFGCSWCGSCPALTSLVTIMSNTETFTLNGVSCGMELFEVDLAKR